MAKVQVKLTSSEWRKKGNELYLAATADIAPVLRKDRIQQSISCYCKALELKTNDDELASSTKNLAMASWRLSELMGDKYSHIYQLHEAAKYFSMAYDAGLSSKPGNWNENLLTTMRSFLDDVLSFSESLNFHERSRFLVDIANNLTTRYMKALCFLKLADTTFKAGITALEMGKYKECKALMHETYTPVEEARRFGDGDLFVETEIKILKEDIYSHQCTSESLQAQATGDELFATMLMDQDNLNIDMVWDVVDWYKNSILLTREKDVEYEAIGHSRLGKVYDKVLKLKNKAKENFMRCLQLVNSMHPRCFTTEKWYQECTEALERYQQETVQQEEAVWSKEKNAILVELKAELDKVKEVADDAEKLLRHIYKVHPPKNTKNKLNESLLSGENMNMKKALREGLLHYHPDRLRVSDFGKKWVVLCEEITKYLNRKYEVFK